MKRFAFTMIELVFVIVVAGILAAVIMPRMDRNTLQEAAIQLISHIRYTQHLAMVDDRFDATNQFWFRERWQIRFYQNLAYTNGTCPTDNGQPYNNVWAYSIFSENPGYTGNPDINEMARNPQNPAQFLSGGYNNTLCVTNADNAANQQSMPELQLGTEYDIQDMNFTASCSIAGSQRIAFDHVGRPLRGAFNNYNTAYPINVAGNRLITQQCVITLCSVSCGIANANQFVQIAIEPETGYIHFL